VIEYVARHFAKPCTERVVLGEPLPQPVEAPPSPSSPSAPASSLAPVSTLMPGTIALVGEDLRETASRPFAGLADRLVEEDHAR